MDGKILPVAASLTLMCSLGLQGCASTSAPAPAITLSRAASPASESAAVPKGAVTVENLLRWPLEGPAGVVRTGAELRRAFPGFEPLPPADLHGDGPMQLADGYILSFVLIGVPTESLSIGLESEPCLSPKRAAEISGAVLSPVFQDAHGVDRGKQYDARRNGIRLNFTTTPGTYRCVDTIHVRPIIRTTR